jgi:hypothetical protein
VINGGVADDTGLFYKLAAWFGFQAAKYARAVTESAAINGDCQYAHPLQMLYLPDLLLLMMNGLSDCRSARDSPTE